MNKGCLDWMHAGRVEGEKKVCDTFCCGNIDIIKITLQRTFYLIQYFPCLDIAVTYANCKIGMTVRRGRNWKWGDEDYKNGVPGTGIISKCNGAVSWATVIWSTGTEETYRIGADNSYDLSPAGNN